MTLILLASSLRAQTESPRDSISAARSHYTQDATAQASANDADPGTVIAQYSRRPVLPPRPHAVRARGNYGSAWADHDHGHAVIGALIGLGAGVALASTVPSNHHPQAKVGAVVLFGSFGALIGGVVGANHGRSYAFAHRSRMHPAQPQENSESGLDAVPAAAF